MPLGLISPTNTVSDFLEASNASQGGPRSLISRLTSQFGPKSRTIVEFVIHADDPHRRYSAGDLVTGSIILKLVKATRITHIVISLYGYVQVFKNPNTPPSEGYRAYNATIGKAKPDKKGQYLGNGFATLFEDEQVVCREGRLEEGNYKFEFAIRFPDETLPSTIDFERGTITYMVSATLTRPKQFGPIVRHSQKLNFVERIDISKLLPPQVRTISLEPLVKPARNTSMRRYRSDQVVIRREEDAEARVDGNDDNTHPSQVQNESVEELQPPRTPSPELSTVSQRSSNKPISLAGSFIRSVSRASDGITTLTGSSDYTSNGKTIHVTVESQKGGALRGHVIPLKLNIDHNKQVKSMQGIIITLYRLARIDASPKMTVGASVGGEKRSFEDYYPKSFSGLSIAGGGSIHNFRKDLQQVVLPLFIDPKTLSAELHPRLRVPEDCFPTIACVPAAMMSFKYYIEVILDIQGKLSGSAWYFPSALRVNYNEPIAYDPEVGSSSVQGFLDTAAIRRDKRVISCTLEIVIGTEESDRQKGKQVAPLSTELSFPDDLANVPNNTSPVDGSSVVYTSIAPPAFGEHNHVIPAFDAAFFVPPPDMEDSIDEKERLRRAEAALLPSAPPDENYDDYPQPNPLAYQTFESTLAISSIGDRTPDRTPERRDTDVAATPVNTFNIESTDDPRNEDFVQQVRPEFGDDWHSILNAEPSSSEIRAGTSHDLHMQEHLPQYER